VKKICVLGLGYIGLPTASIFATRGYQVVGVDVNAQVVETLNNGDVHLQEPGLKIVVQAALRSGNLSVRAQPEPADVFIIAVPTPLISDGESPMVDDVRQVMMQADLSYIRAATESIVPCLAAGNLVILESTSPPGTTEKVVTPILECSGLKAGQDIFVAHCPERVLPGRILEELVRNDRVIGGVNRASAEMAKALYASNVEGQLFLADATTVEMVKLMENAYRDVNIALANEFALVAEQLGTDVWEAIELANRHPRVNILKPGPGVGGHCIAVDPWFIVQAAPEVTPLIQAARRVNDEMPAYVVEMVNSAVEGIDKPVIACLGLAYKADVDDTRDSPAIKVVELLRVKGFEVRAYDPYVKMGVVPGQVGSIDSAVESADCVVFLTDHDEFRQLSLDNMSSLHGSGGSWSIVDTRNVLAAQGGERTANRRLLGRGKVAD